MTQTPSIETEHKIKHTDKLVHLIAFASITLLGAISFSNKKTKVVLFLFLYGIAIEIIQDILPFNRHFEYEDIIADGIGISIGLATYLLVHKKYNLPENHSL